MKTVKTLFKALLLLSALGYLVFAIIKVSRSPQDMVCTGMEYHFQDSAEVRLVEGADVDAYLEKQGITAEGKPLSDIDMRKIEQVLTANPYIDTVTCHYTAAGKLCVRIKPLHPLLHVFANDGGEFYVDGDGNFMSAGGQNVDLPVVTGYARPEYVVAHLLPLGRMLKEDDYWNELTEQIDIDDKGKVKIITRYAGQQVLIGDPEDFEEKLERVRLFYEKGMPKVGWNKYRTINASYKGQIICTKK